MSKISAPQGLILWRSYSKGVNKFIVSRKGDKPPFCLNITGAELPKKAGDYIQQYGCTKEEGAVPTSALSKLIDIEGLPETTDRYTGEIRKETYVPKEESGFNPPLPALVEEEEVSAAVVDHAMQIMGLAGLIWLGNTETYKGCTLEDVAKDVTRIKAEVVFEQIKNLKVAAEGAARIVKEELS